MIKEENTFGLWGWIDNSVRQFGGESWSIIVTLGDISYRVDAANYSGGIVKESDHVNGDNQVLIKKVDDSYNHFIPVKLGSLSIFTLLIECNNELPIVELVEFKRLLEALNKLESENYYMYPTFLPVFLPLDEFNVKINNRISEKSNFFFLNGNPGTGKKTFIQNYISYHFYCNIDVADIYDKATDNECNFKIQRKNEILTFSITKEVALLEQGEQLNLVKKIEASEENSYHFICSNYDPAVLYDRGMLVEEMKILCIDKRVIFQALQKRTTASLASVLFYMRSKGLCIEDENMRSYVENEKIETGYLSIIDFWSTLLEKRTSIAGQYRKGRKLRDIVAHLEVESIWYAIYSCGRSQNKIARYLGISRGSLQHKLKKYEFPYNGWEE